MKLFGRGGRVPTPASDADLADRLKDVAEWPLPQHVRPAAGAAEPGPGAAPDEPPAKPEADPTPATVGGVSEATADATPTGAEMPPGAAPDEPAKDAVAEPASHERGARRARRARRARGRRADADGRRRPAAGPARRSAHRPPRPRGLRARADRRVRRGRRYRRPATLVLTELAGLDELTRSWGVEVGVQAVVSLASVLRATSRTSDYVARVAVDRFAIILTETDEIAAINYVERVREAWSAQQVIAMGALRVGIGWAGTPGRATLVGARPDAEKILRDDLR